MVAPVTGLPTHRSQTTSPVESGTQEQHRGEREHAGEERTGWPEVAPPDAARDGDAVPRRSRVVTNRRVTPPTRTAMRSSTAR